MKLTFLGAAHMVTGSCYLLESMGKKFLVDCGMFQGGRRTRDLNYREFQFIPADIDCVLLTHAHIDHCGLLPKLCKEGFRGEIFATKVTTELAQIMLPDAAHIQEYDTQIMNRKGQRSGDEPVQPLYTMEDAVSSLKHFVSVEYNERFAIADHISVCYRDAGHIMGSAIIEIFIHENGEETKLVFSGDLGQPDQPILKNPTAIKGADYLIVESTYGDRLHQMYDREQALLDIIQDTMDRGGNVIIPSFAVGRTQTLLYYFYKLWKEGRMEDIPIILDSPLAISATRIFMENMQDFDEEAIALFSESGGTIPQMPHLHICKTAEESRALNSRDSSAVIISASGMADAGRVLHHLKHNLWRPESTVLFVGYQAEGSLGRRLLDGAKRVRVLGEEIVVRANIKMLDGFSAHADLHQIMDWLEPLQEPRPAKIYIVHGEAPAAESLKEQIEKKLGEDVYIPFYGDMVNIEGRTDTLTASALPEIHVEMEMEDFLRTVDSTYRQQRRRLLQYVVRNPQHMETVIRTMQKGWNYMRRLFSNYNI
ncbi:MBL fold metallo-hydrolase [Selenomonas sp. TAMA-11512]|uniref:MBL fold metallo-hydrolase n=1 Tax=Selenomonas sp. TAMA-11512 TaxID=3095337 RepID=UPI0030884240|nr:MBL fold metallo-hydrolase [Selenomonas sp. TAMA-11512]